MTAGATASTDKGFGLTLVFAALVVVGAVAMIVGALELGGVPEVTAAWGFAGAMLFATAAIVAIHLWE